MNDITTERSGSFIRKLLIVLIPILIVVGFFIITQIIVAMNKEPETKRRPFNPLAVLADVAVRDDVQLIVNTQGEARPRTEIDLVPEVGGKIISVSPKFLQGGIFQKGDILFQIDRSDYQTAVIRAEAAVARVQQVLVREEAEAEIARKDWEDLGQGAPSDLTLRKPQMAEAKAALQSAQADLRNAKTQLSRTSVRAPFDGRVRSKTSDIGQFVGPGARLGRIFSTDIVEVRVPLTDDDLSKVNLPIAFVAKDRDSAPSVTLSATIGGERQVWNAKIMRTDSVYDTQTRALFAIAEVFDPYGEGASETNVPLAPGLFVDAQVKGKSFEQMIVLPRDGLRPEGKVFIAKEDGTAEIRTPTVIDTNATYAYLKDGVTPGEYVILSPVEESRLPGPLKVLNIHDTSEVFVNPPKPQWLLDKENAEDEKSEGKKRKKKKNKKDEKPKDTQKDGKASSSGDANSADTNGGDTP